MSKKVGIVVTGGAVSTALINRVVTSSARAVRRHHFVPYILCGGYSSLLTRGQSGIYEITKELSDRWERQKPLDYTIDRSLPRRTDEELGKILKVLQGEKISRMIVIGGNGSSLALSRLYNFKPEYFNHLVQILKTMDGDCQSPFWNLGFASALYHAKVMLNQYSNELSGYGSPFVIEVMGREVGQLAFHMGLQLSDNQKGLILIREELGDRKLSSEELSNLLICSAIKRLSLHGNFAPLVLSEGLIDCLTPEAQKEFGVNFNDEGQTNFADANLKGGLKDLITKAMKNYGIYPYGIPPQVGARRIGYDSRSGAPVPEDMELAVEYGGRAGFLATREENLPYPTLLLRDDNIDLRSIINPKTNEPDQCWVNPKSHDYQSFIRNQYRLYPSDLYGESLVRLARCTNLPASEFRNKFMKTAELFSSFRESNFI